MGKRPARQVFEFDSMADFEADGGVKKYGFGTVMIAGDMYVVRDPGFLVPRDETIVVKGSLAGDMQPKYDIMLTDMAANGSLVRSGAPMTVGGSRVTDTATGCILEWDAGLNLVDGNYIAIAYIPVTPLDLSGTDRLMFEFVHDNNWINTRLQIIVSSVSTTATGASHRYVYQSSKRNPEVALMLTKSDFEAGGPFSGTGVNWADVKRIEFRFTKHSTGNPNQRARVQLKRALIGAKTRPLVLYTHDDNAVEIYNAFLRHKKYGFRPDIFCTDYEIPGEINWTATKCTLQQNQEMAANGCRFYPHNVSHKAFSQAIVGYTLSGTTVTLTIQPFGGGNPEEIMPAVGDYIIIDEASAEQLNGRWAVQTITLGNSDTTNTTITINVPGASFTNTASNDGATMTVEKYDYVADMESLRAMLARSGLPTDKKYLAYTYGRNSRTNHKALAKAGFRLCRGTTGSNGQSEHFANQIFQINRKWGMGGDSSRLMAIPTIGLTDALINANGLEPLLQRLVEIGGVLSVYCHCDTDITPSNHDIAMSLIADYQDKELLNVVNMRELDAHINARR